MKAVENTTIRREGEGGACVRYELTKYPQLSVEAKKCKIGKGCAYKTALLGEISTLRANLNWKFIRAEAIKVKIFRQKCRGKKL